MNWRLTHFCKGIPLPTRGIHIDGPAGVGKSTLVRALASRHNLQVLACQAMDLVIGPDGKPRSLESLVSELVSQPGLRTDKPCLMHMQNVDMLRSGLAPDLALFALATIRTTLCKDFFTVVTAHGEKTAVSFNKNLLFVAESRSGVQTKTIGFGQKPSLAAAAPCALDELMSIHCQPLDVTHFRQLARSIHGPVRALISEMSAKAGIHIEIDDAALDELATRAHATHSQDGGYALAGVLLNCIEETIRLAPAGGLELASMRFIGGLRPQIEWREAAAEEQPDGAAGQKPGHATFLRQPRASEGDPRLATLSDLQDIVITE